jgi:transposase
MDHQADAVFKQKAVIELLTKEGVAAKNINNRLVNVYGDLSLSYPSVRRWVAHFKSGNSEIADKLRAGRPPSATIQANRTGIDEIIRNDRRVTVLDIIQTIGIGIHAVQSIIAELGYRKVCARWVPRQLTNELKQTRLDVCTQQRGGRYSLILRRAPTSHLLTSTCSAP